MIYIYIYLRLRLIEIESKCTTCDPVIFSSPSGTSPCHACHAAPRCSHCATHFVDVCEAMPPRTESRKSYSVWNWEELRIEIRPLLERIAKNPILKKKTPEETRKPWCNNLIGNFHIPLGPFGCLILGWWDLLQFAPIKYSCRVGRIEAFDEVWWCEAPAPQRGSSAGLQQVLCKLNEEGWLLGVI